jgi:hypothetical protein
MPKEASRRIAKMKKIVARKARFEQRQKEMAMSSIAEVHVTLHEFWASRYTCAPFPKCSAPNTFIDKGAHNFAKEITCIMLNMLNQKSMEFQRTMMEKFLHLPSLQPLLPKFVQN